MTAIRELTATLIKAGMDPADAAVLVARAGAEFAVAAPSKAALRTRKWRANQPSQTVTSDGSVTLNETVTERHKTSPVTSSDDASLSKKESKKEESKKERGVTRASQIPEGWHPDETAWQASFALIGQQRCELELKKFLNHAADKGRVSKNWNSAWRNWVDRAIDYGATNGTRNFNTKRGSASSDFFAGMRSVAEDISGNDQSSRPAAEEIPVGRVNIEH